MMAPLFWIKRLLTVFALVLVILLAAAVIKGSTVEGSWLESAFWAGISAAAFTVTRYYRARQGQACALCQDLPES